MNQTGRLRLSCTMPGEAACRQVSYSSEERGGSQGIILRKQKTPQPMRRTALLSLVEARIIVLGHGWSRPQLLAMYRLKINPANPLHKHAMGCNLWTSHL